MDHLTELLRAKVTPGNVDDRKPLRDFTVNLLAGLVAYCLMPNKPDLPLQSTNPLGNARLIPN